MDTELTIQQMAGETGLSEHTLRYYERIGLIAPVSRAASGHRRYSSADLGWIDFLKCLRATGMPVAQMKQYADLQRHGDPTYGGRLSLLENHRQRVLEQLEELRRSLDVIEYKIGYYSKEREKLKEALPEEFHQA